MSQTVPSNKKRLDRRPGRSGQPLSPPLTCRVTNAEIAAFKRLASQRGMSVNRVLAGLVRAELKTWENVGSRIETNFHQFGVVPTLDPTIDKTRAKEAERDQRQTNHTAAAANLDR